MASPRLQPSRPPPRTVFEPALCTSRRGASPISLPLKATGHFGAVLIGARGGGRARQPSRLPRAQREHWPIRFSFRRASVRPVLNHLEAVSASPLAPYAYSVSASGIGALLWVSSYARDAGLAVGQRSGERRPPDKAFCGYWLLVDEKRDEQRAHGSRD